jgi:hypothetical protein
VERDDARKKHIYVPFQLKHISENAYFAACSMPTQKDADRIIKRHIPEWRGWRDLPSRRRGTVGDFQMTGQHTLESINPETIERKALDSPKKKKPRPHEVPPGPGVLRSVVIEEG